MMTKICHAISRRIRRTQIFQSITDFLCRAHFWMVGRHASTRVRFELTQLSRPPEKSLGQGIVILTAFTQEIAEYGLMTACAKELYSKKRNYRFVCYQSAEDFDADRDPTWSKISFILKEFQDHRVSWVFWTDADAAIANDSVWIENLVDEGADLVISSDATGLNAGNFLIRNSLWAKELLHKAWERVDLARSLFHEQQAISELIDSDWNGALARVKVVSQRLFNSYHYPDYLPMLRPLPGDGSFQAEDFILHVPALPKVLRIERLKPHCRALSS